MTPERIPDDCFPTIPMECQERRSPGFRGGQDLWECPRCHRRLLRPPPANLIIGELMAEGEVAPRCDCLAREVLCGPKLDADGRIVGGVYHGMKPAEVLADRDAFNRACGGAEKQRFD
jgi:hypothetical protein